MKTSVKGSNFIFDLVQLLYYKCHGKNFIGGTSYNDYPDWIKKEKITINLKSKDDVFNIR